METAELTKTVDEMSESLAQPADIQEGFKSWAARAEKEARQEERKDQKAHGPREMKGSSDEERDWFKKVGQPDEAAKEESPRDSAERGDSVRSEQRSDRESTNVRGAHKEEQGKLTGAELDNRWRQISGGNPAWQKAHPTFQAELVKVLGGVESQKDVMQYLAAHPEELHNVKDVRGLQAAVHQIATRESMSAEVKQATVRHPDAAEKIKSATAEVMSEKTPFFVKAFINDSEVLGELLYTLADQTTLNNLLETAKASPGKALRVLRDMELDIRKALSNERAPEMRPRPRAPRPPTELQGRSAAGDDGTNGEMSFRDFSRKMDQRYAHAR